MQDSTTRLYPADLRYAAQVLREARLPNESEAELERIAVSLERAAERKHDAVVIVTRHPDYANTEQTFPEGRVWFVDVDLGGMDLRDPSDWREWSSSQLEEAAKLEAAGHVEAAEALRANVVEQRGEFGHAE